MPIDARQLDDYKYINLETYKRDGKPVSTPVWFVIENKSIFIVTRSSTGKVKRLKNNPNVRVVPCGFRGEPKGDWINGVATFVSPDETGPIIYLRNKKYGIKAKLVSLFTGRKGETVVISVHLT